jgi:hypothetical protein
MKILSALLLTYNISPVSADGVAQGFINNIAKSSNAITGAIKNAAGQSVEKADEATQNAVNSVAANVTNTAKDVTTSIAETAEDAVQNLANSVTEKATDTAPNVVNGVGNTNNSEQNTATDNNQIVQSNTAIQPSAEQNDSQDSEKPTTDNNANNNQNSNNTTTSDNLEKLKEQFIKYSKPLDNLYNDTIDKFALASNTALCVLPNDFEGSLIDGNNYQDNKKKLIEHLEQYKNEITEFTGQLGNIPQEIDKCLTFLKKLPEKVEDINNINLQDILN